jgi:hypothetical protein
MTRPVRRMWLKKVGRAAVRIDARGRRSLKVNVNFAADASDDDLRYTLRRLFGDGAIPQVTFTSWKSVEDEDEDEPGLSAQIVTPPAEAVPAPARRGADSARAARSRRATPRSRRGRSRSPGRPS